MTHSPTTRSPGLKLSTALPTSTTSPDHSWPGVTVCSLEREEGEEQIEAFLGAHPEFARVPIHAEELFGHAEWITPQGDLRTLPFQLEGGMDGFYAARLRRI